MSEGSLDWRLLARLCEAPGVSGAEEAVAEVFLEALKQNFSEIESERDNLGNIIFHLPAPGQRLLLDAHLDEVGFMVRKVEKEGFVRVIPIGGIDPRVCYGQQVVIWGKEPLYGIFATTPPHLSVKKPSGEVPPVEEMIIDTGLGDQILDLVSIGDPVTFASGFRLSGPAIMARALDDRLGLFVMVEALKRVRQPAYDLYLVASVSEEVGLKGAQVVGERIRPHLAIALEGTVASDLPGTPEAQVLARLGGGPEIRLSDARFLADRRLTKALVGVAQAARLPYQLVVKNRGGTNAAVFQLSALGARATAISVPVRYLHAPWGLATKSDIEAAVALVAKIIETPGL